MVRRYMNKNKFKKISSIDYKLILVPIIFIILSICTLVQFNNKILPSAMAISHLQAKAMANGVIDLSVRSVLNEMNVKSSDFFVDTKTGEIKSFSINTILINEICSGISENIGKELGKIAEEKIYIPFGTLTGVDLFSNMGPDITFNLRPMGEVYVDYETSFSGVGINQTNFKIWLNVNIGIQIVNPLKNEKITLSRKLMLVDTVINGAVPDNYLNLK